MSRSTPHQPAGFRAAALRLVVAAAAVMMAAAHAAHAQAERRTDIAIVISEQSIRAAGIATTRISPDQGRNDLSFPGTVVIPQHQIRVVAALASANVFPAIAVIFQLDRVRAYKEKARIALPSEPA